MVAVVALAAVWAVSASATTTTRHQNPHLKVTVSLTPTKAEVGTRLTERITVTNVTGRAHRVTVSGELDGPTMGEGFSSSSFRLAAHRSRTFTISMRAKAPGHYTATGRAGDALGASHATATAVAS